MRVKLSLLGLEIPSFMSFSLMDKNRRCKALILLIILISCILFSARSRAQNYLVYFDRLQCIEETKEGGLERGSAVGSDEIYVVIFSASAHANLLSSQALAFRTQVFAPVDKGSIRNEFLPFWGVNGNPASISNVDDVIFLILLMENDKGNPDAVKAAVQSSLSINLLAELQSGNQRDQIIRRLIADMNGVADLGAASGRAFPDDRIGSAQELRLTSDLLRRARSSAVTKTLEFSGLEGRYRLYFNICTGLTEHNDIVGMAMASDDHVFVWFRDGMVSSGTSDELARYRRPYEYSLPPGKTPNDIVGMAVAPSNNHNFVWFRDGTVCSGTSDDLDRHRRPYRYSLPPGKTSNDIVGMAMASDDHVFVWFRDGTVCSGNSNDLDRYRRPYSYSLPPGKSPDDIVGMAIAASNNHNFVCFKDGTVCSGTSDDLDRHRRPYVYSTSIKGR
jgi:hypothetical protein